MRGRSQLLGRQHNSLASTTGLQSIVALHHNGFENYHLYDNGNTAQKTAKDQASVRLLSRTED